MTGQELAEFMAETRGIFEGGGHLSENGLEGSDVDIVLQNDGTIEALYAKLEELKGKK